MKLINLQQKFHQALPAKEKIHRCKLKLYMRQIPKTQTQCHRKCQIRLTRMKIDEK